MKKSLLLLGLGALIFSSCSNNNKKLEEDSIKIADLTADYQEAASFNDSLMLLMGDIYMGLDSINMQEGLLYNMNSNEGVDRRAEIRQNLSTIRSRLEANKKMLAEMEAKVKNSNNQNSVLLKTIDQLKAHIESQDLKISQLENDLANAKTQIDDLNNQVTETQEQLTSETAAKEQAQQETIAAENEANKVFYAMGTNKELKNNGLLEKKFLGATKVLQGNFNTNYFTVSDKRNLSTIHTNSKKVKIWSNMAAGSYEIVENADNTKTIKITNPAKFWSITPYLIIQTD